jgi:limonene-1,2-epoxide hydrolase
MENPNIKIVEAYLNALRVKDLSLAPVADDIAFEDPLTEPSRGRAAWTQFVSGILPALKDVRIKRHIADGDYVATVWDAETIWGIINVCEYFYIEDGQIKEAKAFFDPRVITNAMAGQS